VQQQCFARGSNLSRGTEYPEPESSSVFPGECVIINSNRPQPPPPKSVHIHHSWSYLLVRCCITSSWNSTVKLKIFRWSELDYVAYNLIRLITVAARSKAWTVFVCSNAGIVSSNPTRGMDVCVPSFCACVVLCVDSGLATSRSPVQEVLSNVYRIKNLKKQPRSNKGL
jgi:hypothetical protein